MTFADHLYNLSLSHKQAPLEVRSRFAFTEEQQRSFLRKLKEMEGIQGAVLVSTCNRTEVYFSAQKDAAERMNSLFAQAGRVELSSLKKYYRFYQGSDVIRHLFTVMSGLDSMVLGEDEILGQMREAYKLSCREGCTDYYINTVFQRALNCAKQVKTDTCLSKTSVSVATLSAAEVTHFKQGQIQVLLLGVTGRMGSLIAKDLANAQNVHIYATKREHSPVELPGNVEIIPYKERYRYLDGADVVISATKSPHYTMTAAECGKAVHTEKNRLFLDIAVPADLDPDIGGLPGVTLHNIDYFQTLTEAHSREKAEGSRQAEKIIRQESENTAKELLFHDFLPRMELWKSHFAQKGPEAVLFSLKEAADAEELEILLKVCNRLI